MPDAQEDRGVSELARWFASKINGCMKSKGKVVRTEREDLVVEIASPAVAAEKLGRSVESVLARRSELGFPDALSRRERQKRQQKK